MSYVYDGVNLETDDTTTTPGGTQAGSPLTLLYDGHGSTRAVLDATAAFVQHYAYTVYGIAIGFDEAAALTTRLYSGEAFDSRVGRQYLRARWYDPSVGRFKQLNPFSGNLPDPQSLHKYLYTHGDPRNGRDRDSMGGISRRIGVRVRACRSICWRRTWPYFWRKGMGEMGSCGWSDH